MTFALGQDNAFGQPLESQLRSCLLADAMCRELGADEALRATTYWLSLLRYVGCTGHAHEISTVFGDDVAILAADIRPRSTRRSSGRSRTAATTGPSTTSQPAVRWARC